MAKFAEHTEVPIERSRAELERLLSQHGATATAVFNSPREAAVAFEMQGRRILFRLALPDPAAREFHVRKVNQHQGASRRATDQQARAAWDKACRRKWRSLLIAVKAKLVAVADGVETFEDAFMPHIVMPDGQTVADHVRPRIAQAYREGKVQPLLPGPARRD